MERPSPGLLPTGLLEYERLLALVDQRRFDEAFLRGELLLAEPETGLPTRARTHNLLCWLRIEALKRPAPGAVLHAEEAVRLAEQIGDDELAIQALCNLAAAYFNLSSYPDSERCYREILDRLRQRPELLPYGPVIALQGLSQIALVLEQPELALERLNEAEALCQHGESQPLLAETHRRQSLTLLRLGRPREAARALAKLDEAGLASGPRGLWWRTHLGIARARVEAGLARWSRARELAVNTIALAHELEDLPVLAEATCLLASIEAIEGGRDVRQRARAALTYAIQSGRRDLVADVRERLKAYLHSEV